jgi:predicted  nucleic acid-binding Zn-ribbon protein
MEQNGHKARTDNNYNRRSEFMVEREKLREHMETFQRISQKVLELTLELEKLYKEHAAIQWDIRYLEERINHMAKSLDVEPLPKKISKMEMDQPNGKV